MTPLADEIDAVAGAFSGVVSVSCDDRVEFERAYGLAHRAHEVPNTTDTQFALASGNKALTALTVFGLIGDGLITLHTTARSVLGADLPLIADAVTVEHLLAHTSGIGDFVDEEADGDITDHVLTVPVHELDSTEHYLARWTGTRRSSRPDRASATATAASWCWR